MLFRSSARLQPVGKVEFGASGGAAAARSGEELTKTVCGACHLTGAAGAPKIGDKAAWAPHVSQGLSMLVANAIKGTNKGMPPRGGDSTLTDTELERAIVFMANQSGASFKEPPPPKADKK